MPYIVKDKIAIVTGSAQGIGKEFAKRLLNNGGRVCLSDTNTQIGDETLEELIDIHGKYAVTFKRYTQVVFTRRIYRKETLKVKQKAHDLCVDETY